MAAPPSHIIARSEYLVYLTATPTPGTGVATRRHRKCPVRAHPTFAANAIVTNDREPDQVHTRLSPLEEARFERSVPRLR
jgi:hypothetical protein